MNDRLRRLTLSFLMSVFVPAARAQAPVGDSWDSRIYDFKGDVKVYAPGEDKPLPVVKGMPLDAGDRIVTGADSSVDLSVDGGTLVHLSAATDFTLSETQRKQTSFKLSFGTFLAKVQKLLAGQSLQVEAPTAVAAVRGTEFGVAYDPKNPDESRVGVFDEGKVEVKGQAPGSEMLIGGQETKVAKGQAPLHAFQLDLFKKDREYMRATMKKKLTALKKGWKAVTPAERAAARKKSFEAMRGLREKLEKKSKESERTEKKDGRRETQEGRHQKEKMEKLKQEIRERHGR